MNHSPTATKSCVACGDELRDVHPATKYCQLHKPRRVHLRTEDLFSPRYPRLNMVNAKGTCHHDFVAGECRECGMAA